MALSGPRAGLLSAPGCPTMSAGDGRNLSTPKSECAGRLTGGLILNAFFDAMNFSVVGAARKWVRGFLLSAWHRRILGKDRWRIIVQDGIAYRTRWGAFARKLARNDTEIAEFNFLAQHIRAMGAEIFIDVGAHLGWYAMRVAAQNLCPQIYAIEGSPEVFAALRHNVVANRFGEKIIPICAALSDKKRSAVYYKTSGFHYSGSGLEDSGCRAFHRRVPEGEVETATLDDVLPFQGRCIAVKVDVEGHERRVLQGAKHLLRKNRIFLQIEILPENAAHLNDLIANYGFRILRRIGGSNFFLRNF